MSFLLIGSSNCRPISRLIAKMVRSGLVTAWRLAGWPTRRSPASVNATIEGVVFRPSVFSMILGVLSSLTAARELVVPRSMPMTLPILSILVLSADRPGPCGTRKKRRAGLPPALDRPWSDPSYISPATPAGSERHIGGHLKAARRD